MMSMTIRATAIIVYRFELLVLEETGCHLYIKGTGELFKKIGQAHPELQSPMRLKIKSAWWSLKSCL